jgi:putative lipoprotein
MLKLPALLCLALCGVPPQEPPDRWFGEDKLRHFFASFVATSLSASAARAAGLDVRTSAAVGAGFGAATGAWKEIRDARGAGDPSLRDAVWDAAGVGGAYAVTVRVR